MTDEERLEEVKRWANNLVKEVRLPRKSSGRKVYIHFDFTVNLGWLIKQSERAQELKKENRFLENAHQTNLEIATNEQNENKELRNKIYELERENEKYREKLDRMLIERSAIESKLGQALHELSFYKLKQKEGKR